MRYASRCLRGPLLVPYLWVGDGVWTPARAFSLSCSPVGIHGFRVPLAVVIFVVVATYWRGWTACEPFCTAEASDYSGGLRCSHAADAVTA